jgi:hypothetical protein
VSGLVRHHAPAIGHAQMSLFDRFLAMQIESLCTVAWVESPSKSPKLGTEAAFEVVNDVEQFELC